MTRATCLVVGSLAISFVAGCGGKSREAAQAATERFRARCARGAFAEIYAGAAPEFRASATQEQFVKLMESVGRKLGAWQSAGDPGWRVNWGSAGRTVILGYKSKFEKGSGTEEFVWQIGGKEPILAGYHINSPLFLPD